jgi:hypothetical protein
MKTVTIEEITKTHYGATYTTREALVFMRRALRRFFNLCLFIFIRRFFMVLLQRIGEVKTGFDEGVIVQRPAINGNLLGRHEDFVRIVENLLTEAKWKDRETIIDADNVDNGAIADDDAAT